MAWNEPGGNNNDPWGNKKNDSGPPDLDEVFRNLQKKLEGIFGGKRAGGSGSGSGGSGGFNFPGQLGSIGLLAIGSILLLLWLASGIYIIQPAERGVVTQFGRYVKETTPGPHWRIPWPIQALDRVNVDQTRSIELRQQDILTRDENIVVIDIAVNYTLNKASDYLFNVEGPDVTLRHAAESALRETVGQTLMDTVLTEGRGILADQTLEKIQTTLDSYVSGIQVTALNLRSAEAPAAVKEAFDDVVKAREDQQRFINESEAYRNGVLPQARGEAVVLTEQARAYQAEVVNAAKGEAARFESLLTEYAKAPEITKERLYIESMESVLSKSSKVMVGTGESGNNLMYLPLDKLMNNGSSDRAADRAAPASNEYVSPPPVQPTPRTNDNRRTRTRGSN